MALGVHKTAKSVVGGGTRPGVKGKGLRPSGGGKGSAASVKSPKGVSRSRSAPTSVSRGQGAMKVAPESRTTPKGVGARGQTPQEEAARPGTPNKNSARNRVTEPQTSARGAQERGPQDAAAKEGPVCSNGRCFAAGTLLMTPWGFKRIEEFQVGDEIVSRVEGSLSGLLEVKRVLEVLTRAGEVTHLMVRGRIIRTTEEHPFYAQDKDWQPLSQLRVGDLLSSHERQWIPIEKIENTGNWERLYNLTVEDFHTYFVGSPVWDFTIWAHNAGTDCGGGNQNEGWFSRLKRFFGIGRTASSRSAPTPPENAPMTGGVPGQAGRPFDPQTAIPGQTIRDVNPLSLKPSRRDLLQSSIDTLMTAPDPINANPHDPIRVTRDGRIWDGHHRIRIAAQTGRSVDVVVVDGTIGGPPGTILDLPIR